MTFLIDVHHIGGRQTGNETWSRNIARELAVQGGSDRLVFACRREAMDEVTSLTGTSSPRAVSDSALRRLALDLPRIARQADAGALLVQYTKPLTRRPCVVAIHDLSPFDDRSAQWLTRSFRIRVRASIRHSVASARVVTVLSEFTKRDLVERFRIDPDRIVIVTGAVDPTLADLLAEVASTPRHPDVHRVVAVGNVLPRKNLTTLAAAVARLRSRGSEVELRVVGQVPEEGRALEAELRATLGPAISFSGYVSTTELASEYLAADVFAFPSLYEGFGIPAVEAMQAGLPVVVSDATSLPEVVGDAGVVVPGIDVDAWATALDELLGDDARRAELVGRGRRRAASFSWASSAATVLAALRQAAGSDRRRPETRS
jgi:glycosyltransferase involved in cell wall biosynthesis